MKLKKINAALGLLSIAAMLLHIGYTVFAYLAFYYNPTLKLLTAIPFMALACLHAVCGMLTVFLQADGTRLDLYHTGDGSAVSVPTVTSCSQRPTNHLSVILL